MQTAEVLNLGTHTCRCAVEEPDTCPLCHFSIKPDKLFIYPYWNNQEKYVAVLYLCTHCKQVFCTLSRVSDASVFLNNMSMSAADLLYVGPTRYAEHSFDPAVSNLSPQFVKIYNQALAAESSDLDEIAGIGYRKSLEFLVKDFCIHLHPDKEQEIKEKYLSRCINDYIDNPQIKTLAEKATWIGNDETHYIRKQEGRDIVDMKKFISAMVYFVGMALIAEDADTITSA